MSTDSKYRELGNILLGVAQKHKMMEKRRPILYDTSGFADRSLYYTKDDDDDGQRYWVITLWYNWSIDSPGLFVADPPIAQVLFTDETNNPNGNHTKIIVLSCDKRKWELNLGDPKFFDKLEEIYADISTLE